MYSFAKPQSSKQSSAARASAAGPPRSESLWRKRRVESISKFLRAMGDQGGRPAPQKNDENGCASPGCGASRKAGHRFDRVPVLNNSAARPQSGLTIGEPGDAYERDADRAADQVMRMPQPTGKRACACGGSCPKCKKKGSTQAQLKAVPSRKASTSGTAGSAERGVASPAQELDSATRSYFEPRFGHDFRNVRIHRDGTAARSARELGARAYTVGTDIVFGRGQYAPQSEGGRRLLAHELAHVVQQSNSSQAPQVQRWAYGTGNHTTGGGANLSEVTADERRGANGFDAAMRIVDRVVGNRRCAQWFVDNCTDVPQPTLADLNNRAVVWMWRIADGAPTGNNGLTDGTNRENHAINERLYNFRSRWAMAATMIHEYWHDCERGQPDIGDDAKAACGLPNI